jgi:subtilisin-like proprotein convertase family protein
MHLKYFMKNYIFLFLFVLCFGFFANAQISTFPWNEDFESAGLPSGWTQEYVNASVNWQTYAGGTYGMPSSSYSGTKNAFFSSDNYDDNQTILISPQLDLSSLTNPILSFYHAQIPFDTDQDELRIYYKTSASGPWILLQSYTTAVMSWTFRQIILPETSNDFYIGFSAKSGYGLGVCVDLVEVQNVEPCLDPTAISILQASDSGAVIDWLAGSSESNWQVEYGVQGFTQGGGTLVNTTESTHTFTSLSANEDYDFYVRAYCNPLYSDWVGPFSFSTICAIADIFPYNEGFENTTAPVPCWSMEYANPTPNSGNLMTHSNSFAFEGARSFKFCSYYIGAPYNQYLISRQFDFPQEMQVSFRYRKNTSGTEIFCVGTSSTTDAVSSFTWGENVTNANSTWKYFSLEIPANTKYIAIQYKSNFQNSLFVDDLQIRNATNCYEPVDVTIGTVGSTTAVVGWTAVNGETTWKLEYGTAGFTQGSGTIINTGLNPYTITGLNSETQYDVYVKADCGTPESIFTEKKSFTTLPACLPVTGFQVTSNTNSSVSLSWNTNAAVFYEIEYGVDGFIQGSGTTVSSIVTGTKTITGLLENTAYDFYVRAYCGAANGFSDWSTAVSCITYPCATGCFYTFTLNDYWGDGWGNVSLGIYQDGELTNTLKIESGYTLESQIYICDISNVEIVLNQGSFADECSFYVYTPYDVFVYSSDFETLGSVPDQTVLNSFTGDCSEPDCYPPSNTSYSQLLYSSCMISWQAGNGETSWNVEYGAAGFLPGSGTLISGVTETTYLLNSLTPSMAYDVYIYANCGVSGLSNPVGPVSFTTSAAPIALDICGLSLNIPDNSFSNANFEVSGLVPSSPFTHFNLESVSFIIQHPYDADLELFLESPEGVTVTLIQDNGGIGDNFGDVGGSCTYKTILSLNPVNGSIASGTAPFNGNYSAIGDLNNFNTGADLNGLWKLKIVDDNNLYTGKLQYFNLSFIETKALFADDETFFENVTNDGSISNTISLQLYNESFATMGNLVENTDFEVLNLPSGLSVQINVTGADMADISLVGNAIDNMTDLNNLIISLKNAAFVGGDANAVEGSILNFNIDYLTVINLTNNSVSETVICANETYPVFVDYSFTNNSETTLEIGTEISLDVESPVGSLAFTEVITLQEVLAIGENVLGECTTPLYFDIQGEHTVSTEVNIANDVNSADNEIMVLFEAVTHHSEFPQSVNDTIYVDAFPFGIYATAVFEPVEYTQVLYYFWNGESGSASYDVFAEGWVYLNTESNYCNVMDSIYIALGTSIPTESKTEFSIYPNPANDVIIINSSNIDAQRIFICGVDGRIYIESNITEQNNTFELSVSQLSPGLYFVIVESNTGSYKKNFIKM